MNSDRDPLDVTCRADGADTAGSTTWANAAFHDPASVGRFLGGSITVGAGEARSITWQVDEPPAADYRLTCQIDRSTAI